MMEFFVHRHFRPTRRSGSLLLLRQTRPESSFFLHSPLGGDHTFRSISGASVSANTSTPLSTAFVDLYSYNSFDRASAFESRQKGNTESTSQARAMLSPEHLALIFGTEKDRVNCPFYFKLGACRHGDRCSRLHTKPSISPTLLLSNMYQRPDMITPGVDPQGQPLDPQKIQHH
ncbi:unnamed protein product [Camellia sinensis]